jgi:hypothetical protein
MKKFLVLLVFILANQMAFSWGQNGHRIVAQICFDNLSESAKKCVQDALGDDYLSQIATWPDFIRSEKNWDFAKPWHFITVDTGKTVAEVLNASKNDSIDNVIEAIELMKAILKNDDKAINQFKKLLAANNVQPLSGSIEATAIAFLVHFIGDIHQPMHVGKGNDRGGNNVNVLFFEEDINLHSVWDEAIIEQEQLSFTEFSTFVNKQFHSKIAEFQNAKLASQWAAESVSVRDKIYAGLCNNQPDIPCLPNFSYQYQHDFLPTVQERLAKAGFRAAAAFNAIYTK